ncbi:MAG: hypothetical protein AAF212_08440 [Verrucomicrobiota bacterium]
MPNPLDPEEIKKQIAAARAHLSWLESLLDEGRATSADVSEDNDSASENEDPRPSQELKLRSTDVSTSGLNDSNAEAPAEIPDISEEEMLRLSEGDTTVTDQVDQAKKGCIALALFAVLGLAAIYWIWSMIRENAEAVSETTSASAQEFPGDRSQWS